jgi:phospholipid N-methyltransferase
VLDLLPVALAPQGVLLVIQYSPLILRELRGRFPSVQQKISPWNVPPAFLYACRADAS